MYVYIYKMHIYIYIWCFVLCFCLSFFRIYFWFFWVFLAASDVSLVVVSRDYSSCSARASYSHGFPCCRVGALGAQASEVSVCGLSSCSSHTLECWLSSYSAPALKLRSKSLIAPRHVIFLFLDQGSSPSPLHCKEDS